MIMTAVVTAAGELVSGRHAVEATPGGISGYFYVEFDQSAAGCTRIGTTGNPESGTTAGFVANTELSSTDETDQTVFVITRSAIDENLTQANPFHLLVICD
jgi:hypothetical protein